MEVESHQYLRCNICIATAAKDLLYFLLRYVREQIEVNLRIIFRLIFYPMSFYRSSLKPSQNFIEEY